VNDIVFYFGDVIIIAAFVLLVTKRFKEDDEIDLQKHKWIILTYIILLVMAIITWRIIEQMIEIRINQIINYNKTIEEYSNGKK
jgi:NADH:ubiquinone oxidoreductase subunit 6 (subunit J)